MKIGVVLHSCICFDTWSPVSSASLEDLIFKGRCLLGKLGADLMNYNLTLVSANLWHLPEWLHGINSRSRISLLRRFVVLFSSSLCYVCVIQVSVCVLSICYSQRHNWSTEPLLRACNSSRKYALRKKVRSLEQQL